jgi:hypothetical protein
MSGPNTKFYLRYQSLDAIKQPFLVSEEPYRKKGKGHDDVAPV